MGGSSYSYVVFRGEHEDQSDVIWLRLRKELLGFRKNVTVRILPYLVTVERWMEFLLGSIQGIGGNP